MLHFLRFYVVNHYFLEVLCSILTCNCAALWPIEIYSTSLKRSTMYLSIDKENLKCMLDRFRSFRASDITPSLLQKRANSRFVPRCILSLFAENQ